MAAVAICVGRVAGECRNRHWNWYTRLQCSHLAATDQQMECGL